MAQLERVHVELVMECAEFSRSMAEINYSQVGLPRFLDQNEKSQPPHERMTKLETTMAELERVCVEQATPRVPFKRGVLIIPFCFCFTLRTMFNSSLDGGGGGGGGGGLGRE